MNHMSDELEIMNCKKTIKQWINNVYINQPRDKVQIYIGIDKTVVEYVKNHTENDLCDIFVQFLVKRWPVQNFKAVSAIFVVKDSRKTGMFTVEFAGEDVRLTFNSSLGGNPHDPDLVAIYTCVFLKPEVDAGRLKPIVESNAADGSSDMCNCCCS
jgi:hypothetical protein